MGPFTATSGLVVPYYLNVATNFLDKNIAPKIIPLFAKFMAACLPKLPKDENGQDQRYIVCGMEMAGGIITGQLASAQPRELNQLADFVYIRKEKKTSGTCQQLEGPNFITKRTPNSQVAKGVWVDDVNSTGSSLKVGIKMLKALHNIEVTHAFYLVDRFQDRQSLSDEKQHLASLDVKIIALYDLEQVDQLINSVI